MTLKEKFKSLNTNFGRDAKYYHHNLIKCKKIADDYAIDFAKWVQFHSELWIKYKTSELLEIFKKEKGL
jgi:hypothetical protein